MLSFDLPAIGASSEPAFADALAAHRWVAALPLAQAQESAVLLREQVLAIDASSLPVADRLAILDVLRRAALQLLGSLEARFSRKPLPPSADIALAFQDTRQLWRSFAVAYLRVVPGLLPAAALVPLHRAAVILRQEQYSHFVAAYEVPAELYRLLYGILVAAEESDLLRAPVVDPDLGFAEDSHIAGHVAWAFLLQAVDPYRLSLAQLTVANRGFSRWRELAGFQAAPESDPKAKTLSLATLLPGLVTPEGGLRWLDVRPVVRKMRKRVESLEAGESPESLKLGRELSVAGCIALMKLLEKGLRSTEVPANRRFLPVHLAFGPEQAYVAIERRLLNPQGMDSKSEHLSHERMAVFGFDHVSGLSVAVHKTEVASEAWELAGDYLWRPAAGKLRHLAPALVALVADTPQACHLGVLVGLRMTEDDRLAGYLRLYRDQPVAARLRPSGPLGVKVARIPAFLLPEDGGTYSLVVPPTAGVRPHTGLALDDSPVEHLLVGDVLERGSDFVRYACHAN